MKKTIYYLVLALLIIVCSSVAYGAYYYYSKYQKLEKENSELVSQKSKLEKELKALTEEDEERANDEADVETEEKSTGVNTSDWETYTNSKYGFSFKYPASYSTAGCPTKPCGEFIGEESGGDQTIIQGDISEVGWPNISIMHLSSEYYNPPENTDLRAWILEHYTYYEDYISLSPNYTIVTAEGESYPAFDFTYPSSPQSYSQRYVQFINDDDEMFVIQMYDYENYSADFYDAWLDNFIY